MDTTRPQPPLVEHGKVNWHYWSGETRHKAMLLEKPIFMTFRTHSTGSDGMVDTGCFCDQEVIYLLNALFIPIKVDAGNHPDLEAVYRLHMRTAGIDDTRPASIFLTPKLDPILGGTQQGQPHWGHDPRLFEQILLSISEKWRSERVMVMKSASTTTEQLRCKELEKSSRPAASSLEPISLAAKGQERVLQMVKDRGGILPDSRNHSFSCLYKFCVSARNEQFRCAALNTMCAMAYSDRWDHIGGGIACSDRSAEWVYPRYEQSLLDQALLLDMTLRDPYTYAFAQEIVNFLMDGPLKGPKGWYNGLSGSYEYYTWTYSDFCSAFEGAPNTEAMACALYYGIEWHRNSLSGFEVGSYRISLRIFATFEDVARILGSHPQFIYQCIQSGKKRLFNWRHNNKAPLSIDRRIPMGRNSLVIAALAKASRILKRTDALETATKAAAEFFQPKLKLSRFRGNENSGMPVFAEDFAYMIHGILGYVNECPISATFRIACELQDEQIRRFWDANGGFFASESNKWLTIRIKSAFDPADPSLNGISLQNMWDLACMSRNSHYAIRCRHLIAAFGADLEMHPEKYVSMLPTMWYSAARVNQV